MKNQKGFIPVAVAIIIAVLVIGFTGAAIYYETQKDEVGTTTKTELINTNIVTNTNAVVSNTNTVVDETDDWQTYKNTSFGFSVKYPSDWDVQVSESHNQMAFTATNSNSTFGVYPRGEFDHGLSEVISTETIILDGQTVRKITYEGELINYEILSFTEFVLNNWNSSNRIEIFPANVEDVSILESILNSFTFIGDDLSINKLETERLVGIYYPDGFTLTKSTEENRRGSYISYNITSDDTTAPIFQEIQLFSRESVETFNNNCGGSDIPCFFGDYPTVERFDLLQNAYSDRINYEDYILTTIAGSEYLIKNIKSVGDIGYIREYNKFVGTTMVSIWIHLGGTSDNDTADAMLSSWQFNYLGY